MYAIPGQQSQINTFEDALSQYQSGYGGVVPAGAGLLAEMRADASYEDRVKSEDGWVATKIKQKLDTVPKTQITGTIQAAPGSFVGQLNSTTLGSYGLGISYNATWHAGPWSGPAPPPWRCSREVSAAVTVHYSLNTDWNFNWNPEYNWVENIVLEVIPGWIAGADGTPVGYTISGSLSESYNLKVQQKK